MTIYPFKPKQKKLPDNYALFREQGFLLATYEEEKNTLKLIREESCPDGVDAWFSLMHTTITGDGATVSVLTFTELGKAIDVFNSYTKNNPTLDKKKFLQVVMTYLIQKTITVVTDKYIVA